MFRAINDYGNSFSPSLGWYMNLLLIPRDYKTEDENINVAIDVSLTNQTLICTVNRMSLLLMVTNMM
jgi:hypothetical protein